MCIDYIWSFNVIFFSLCLYFESKSKIIKEEKKTMDKKLYYVSINSIRVKNKRNNSKELAYY